MQCRSRHHYAAQPRRSLTICASLVQNPANLGGLCRTAEVFRLERLAIAEALSVRQSAFKDLAVSAHYWQPLVYWPLSSLEQQIKAEQQQGYRIIALHQDAGAIPLPDYVFASQSLLILGRELTGIPPNIAALADDGVMIPQAGLIESLNVQVAGAIATYEYARQHPIETLL